MGLAADNMLRGASVLIVDDHDAHRMLLANYLGAIGCSCKTAAGGIEALAKIAEYSFDLILLDLRMDDLDGMEVLKRARESGYTRDCIMMSAEGTISHAVEALRLGASDFLVKPFELEQLHELIRRVVGARSPHATGERDPRLVWREVFLVLERIAHTDCTVLILGESGTGKELVARALHEASPRVKKAFVPVNCGAIPETLIESELFGHAKGAFSGASSARDGRFAVADGGTLFLDEIGEMSLAVQVKFLRVLQEQEYVPVGETRPRKCDVRIVAATNKNLEQMAEAGTFREDLFYRLNLIPLHLPPLRERRGDIPALLRHFLDVQSKRRGSKVGGISDDALDVLSRYQWPGNVRELENVVERMTLLHSGSGVLGLADLPAKIVREARRDLVAATNVDLEPATPVADGRVDPATSQPRMRVADEGPAAPAVPSPIDIDAVPIVLPPRARTLAAPEDFLLPDEGLDLRRTVEAFENNLIDQALVRTGGNKNQASMLLGLNRTTLVEKLRKRQRRGDAGSADPTG
jgi:DNA-binding NtrC family response regulator